MSKPRSLACIKFSARVKLARITLFHFGGEEKEKGNKLRAEPGQITIIDRPHTTYYSHGKKSPFLLFLVPTFCSSFFEKLPRSYNSGKAEKGIVFAFSPLWHDKIGWSQGCVIFDCFSGVDCLSVCFRSAPGAGSLCQAHRLGHKTGGHFLKSTISILFPRNRKRSRAKVSSFVSRRDR